MTALTPFFPHFLTTVLHRPYVFLFFFTYLIFGRLQLGWFRTLAFLFLGWTIAFASEASSIRNGFPYGDYQYVYENLKGELILWGVPLWDSLSYTFLAYASFATATFIRMKNRLHRSQGDFFKVRTSWSTLILSVILMAGIDVIIDPLTALGDQWFLGRIYYYPNGGFYFGVPISNFLGWMLVAFLIVGIYQHFEKRLENQNLKLNEERWDGLRGWLGVFLYLGVFLFNWGITVWIGQSILAMADLVLVSPLVYRLVQKIRT